jgi:hypothetical protein
MEVDAGGEYYYLSFAIEKTEDGLKGSISESAGFECHSFVSTIMQG